MRPYLTAKYRRVKAPLVLAAALLARAVFGRARPG
jgi:hypothetical protein